MKTLISFLVSLAATFSLIAPRVSWAATPDSLDDFIQVPVVKQLRDAWTKCGPSGTNCPNKKFAEDVSSLQIKASKACVDIFLNVDEEKIGPCQTAVSKAPKFSAKVGGSIVEPINKPPKQPVVVAKPPEPPPEPPKQPVVVAKQPEPPPQPPKPDTDTKPVTIIAPKPSPPSSNEHLVLLMMIVCALLIGLNGYLIFRVLDKGKATRPTETSSAEEAEIRDLREKVEQLEEDNARLDFLVKDKADKGQ